MTAAEQKQALRREMLAKRSKLSEEYCSDAAAKILRSLRTLDLYKEATDLCLYAPIRKEVNLLQFILVFRSENKRVYLPRVQGDRMDFYRYEIGTELAEGAYHIPEPISQEILDPSDPDKICLIILPGAAFSEERNRIGYGGGYYDRYLALHGNCRTAAVGYAMQYVEHIEAEPMDIRPDCIIFDDRIISAKNGGV